MYNLTAEQLKNHRFNIIHYIDYSDHSPDVFNKLFSVLRSVSATITLKSLIRDLGVSDATAMSWSWHRNSAPSKSMQVRVLNWYVNHINSILHSSKIRLR